MPMELFTCSLCDVPVARSETEYMVPLGNRHDSTVVRVCYKCFVTINSYETMKALEAGEYEPVRSERR